MKHLKTTVFFIFFFSCQFSWNVVSFADDLGLIETQTLYQNIAEWTILDARPKSEWVSGHIPGALSFSWEDYTKKDENGIPYKVWTPQETAKALGAMGIDEKSPIVVYGDAKKSWGGEGWDCWVLSWLGHLGPIRLLNGGIQSWKNNRLPLKQGDDVAKRKRVQYKVKLNPEIDITTSEIVNQKSDIVLIDTRSTLERFRGEIPGSIHIPWDDFFSGKERRPVQPIALKNLLTKKGVDTNKTIVYYCTGGMRSGFAWLVHQLSGLPPAKNYEGGYEAWKRFRVR